MVSGRCVDWLTDQLATSTLTTPPDLIKTPPIELLPVYFSPSKPTEHFSSTFGYISKSLMKSVFCFFFCFFKNTMLQTWLSIQFVANKPLIAKCPDTVIVFMGRL